MSYVSVILRSATRSLIKNCRLLKSIGLTSTGLPDAQQLTKQDEFANMVRRMVGGQDDLSKVRLALPVGNPGREIDLRILCELYESLSIFLKIADAPGPRFRRRRRHCIRPIVVRPMEILVVR